MDTSQFETLIQQVSGMTANTLGSKAVESALKRRLHACELKEPASYLTLLRNSADEMQALIDEVVVPETWFFRNREAFDALAREAQTKLRQSDAPLRILSLPCSTGEEPYSMSMALLDAGVPATRFHIDGVDICAQSIALARSMHYSSNSFRGKNLSFRDRYFSQQDKVFELADKVKRQVRLRQGNMLSPDFMPESGIFDFIFCRNVLIYFDRETQAKAVSVLSRLLKNDGIIFAGTSESGILMENGFSSVQWPHAFAFVKKLVVKKPETAHTPLATSLATPPKKVTNQVTKPAPTLPVKKAPKVAATPVATPQQAQHHQASAVEIADISRLADQGKLAEALQLCQTLLSDNKPSAQLYYLTGLVYDTSQNLELAEQFYRKALYLEPSHYEAMMHLIYLLETHGRAPAAVHLRQRSKRLQAQHGQEAHHQETHSQNTQSEETQQQEIKDQENKNQQTNNQETNSQKTNSQKTKHQQIIGRASYGNSTQN